MSAWSEMISDETVYARLRGSPDRACPPLGTLDNVMRVQSPRPSTTAGQVKLPPGKMDKADVNDLRDRAWTDGQIQEINQSVGHFCYVNRLLNGLGVTTHGDVAGNYAET